MKRADSASSTPIRRVSLGLSGGVILTVLVVVGFVSVFVVSPGALASVRVTRWSGSRR